MSVDFANCKINYLECIEGKSHEGEKLNFVCIDLKCKENGLICSVCRSETHKNHKVMPLKMFLSDLSSNF